MLAALERAALIVKDSFDYTKVSALHRKQAQNRRLKKIATTSLVVGGFCVFFALLWLALLPMRSPKDQEIHRVIMFAYLGAGTFFLLLAWFLTLLRHRVMHGSFFRRRGYRRKTRKRQQILRKRDRDARRHSHGGVLIMVLVLLGLTTALLLQAQMATRRRVSLRQAGLEQVRLRAAAADAIRAAMQRLADDEDLTFDTLEDDWAQPIEHRDPTGIELYVTVEDENRFFDLNNLRIEPVPGTATRSAHDILLDLLNGCGIFTAIPKADNIRDWIDDDDIGLRERAFYMALDPPYEPPNRWLYTWNELLAIDEIERPLFDRRVRRNITEAFAHNLIDTVTLIPVERGSPVPVNVNTAPPNVLLGVLGFGNERAVEMLQGARQIAPIRSLEALAAFAPEELIEQVGPYVDVRSSFFRIRAYASVPGHTEQVLALVQRESEGNVKILQWIF